MKYLSVCSGIEAATVAWHDLGFEPIGFSEIEKFPCAVLAHHYPTVPNFGDMTKYKEWPIGKESFDILVGGTPCQSFSVAGLRKGMDDPRGNLALVYCGILDHFRPKWFVWENVPGVLSSSGGRDFGSFLGAVAELGYGFAYRVLDAQFFGVAQRRRRVFVVGYLGDWRPPAAVLFERESLRRDTAPRREKGKGTTHDVAPCIGASGRGFERTGETRGQDPVVATARMTAIGEYADDDTASTLKQRDHKDATDLVVTQYGDVAGALTARHDSSPCADRGMNVVAFAQNQLGEVRAGEVVGTLNQNSNAIGRNTPMVACYENHAQDSRIKDCGDLSPQPNAKAGTGGNNLPLVQKIPVGVREISPCITAKMQGSSGWAPQNETEHLVAVAPTITASNDPSRSPQSEEVTRQVFSVFASSMAVRRLTLVECERLQGFPDNYTKISDKTADGPRYKALGNSMAVPVMKWIGAKIKLVDGILK